MERGWGWGIIPLREEEYKELAAKAGKLEAIEALMREQRYIKIFQWNDGSIRHYAVGGATAGHMQSKDGRKLALAILAILFPDDPKLLEAEGK